MTISKFLSPKVIFALSLMLISNLGWIVPLITVPWLPWTVEQETAWAIFWIVFGQITYNIGLFLAGAVLIKKLRARKVVLEYFWNQYRLLKRFLKKLSSRRTFSVKRHLSKI
jgi:hypothetical protein